MESGKILKGLAIGLECAIVPLGVAKNSKSLVPTYVRQAQTVAVVVDPEADVSLENPRANEVARTDVETAISSWGRFQTVTGPRQADLVIVLRKGNEKAVSETMPAPHQNNRSGPVTRTQDGIGIGAQQGQQPGAADGPTNGTSNGSRGSAPQLEVGNT